MIEPTRAPSTTPVIDELTRKMTAAWHERHNSDHGYRGFHVCECGVFSDNKDHWIDADADRLLTNSLCIHYLAFHRDDVPQEELEKVRALTFGEAEPDEEELAAPRRQSTERIMR